jgi:hypothetical protein
MKTNKQKQFSSTLPTPKSSMVTESLRVHFGGESLERQGKGNLWDACDFLFPDPSDDNIFTLQKYI